MSNAQKQLANEWFDNAVLIWRNVFNGYSF